MDADWVQKNRAMARRIDVTEALWWAIALALPMSFLPLRIPEASLQWVFLAVLALVAELGTIRGAAVWTRFSVPVLAVTWWHSGGLPALMTDLTALAAASVGIGVHGLHRGGLGSLGATAMKVSAASSAASFVASVIVQSAGVGDLGAVIGPASFTLAYLVINECFVRFSGRGFAGFSGFGMFGSIVIVALGVAGVSLVEDGVFLWVPLLLGPLFAIRGYLLFRQRMVASHLETIETLASMLQRSHPYTHRHLERVGVISQAVALRLGLPPARAKQVQKAAVLHDIGKVAIDEDILDLPRKLTSDEFDHVKLHSTFGAEILGEIDNMKEVAEWIRYHHERPDGRGYPCGLLDPEIPVESKIIAAVDAFDAMTGGMEGKDGRPFRDPMSVEEALDELERCSGSQFDARVVSAFREVVGGTA